MSDYSSVNESNIDNISLNEHIANYVIHKYSVIK